MSGTDRIGERLSKDRGGPSNILERFFSKEGGVLRQRVSQCGRYLDKTFGIKIDPIPSTTVIKDPQNKVTTLQHDSRARPSYNFRTSLLTYPSEKLKALDPEHPIEPLILEELGHAYLAQKRPDIREEIVNIVNTETGLTTTSAERFVRIHLWNEGVANIFHRIIGKAWCEQNANSKAAYSIRLSERYEYDDSLRLQRAFRFSKSDREEVDKMVLSKSDIEMEELEDKASIEDIGLIPQIIATLSDSKGFESGRDINELYQAINTLDRIAYRTGYTFVKRIAHYLQDEHHIGLTEAVNWVIANGPPDNVDDFRDPLLWVKANFQRSKSGHQILTK